VIYTVVLAIGAAFVLLPGLDLVPLIILTQNLQALLLPVILIFMVLLVNDPRIMGRHRNGRFGNVLAWGTVGLVIVLDIVLLGVGALGIFGVHVG
jgi:Mn2+/Fe2+ NRAMP family transporter